MEFDDTKGSNTMMDSRRVEIMDQNEWQEGNSMIRGQKTKTLLALLVSLAASQIVYSNIATFLPPYRT